MNIETKLFNLPGFEIVQIMEDSNELTIVARSKAAQATCPDCGTVSHPVHSGHRRAPRDLPMSGRKVRLELAVQRFYCRNPDCKRHTFVERLPGIVLPHAQRTKRLSVSLEKLALELGGELGARIAQQQGIDYSPDTLLRICRQTVLEPLPTPRVLGVDDWAFRRGKTYGTILVDLEKRRVVDLLPERTAEAVAQWLWDHPGIEIVTRDRASVYAEGITQGAPPALQIVDRWHLLKNRGEVLERILDQHRPALRAAAKHLSQRQLPPSTPSPTPPVPDADEKVLPRRQVLFEQVHALASQGYSQRAMARELRIDRVTVARYLHFDEPPASPTRWQNTSAANRYLPYLRQRWGEGCTNARQLWREIQVKGFEGGYPSVARLLKHFRSADGRRTRQAPLVSSVATYAPRQAKWLFVKAPGLLTAEESTYRDALLECWPDAAQIYPLAQRFVQIFQERHASALVDWCKEVLASSIAPLRNFVHELQADFAPVLAALSNDWSNGQTEGQVNRLKYLKRQMYGRANFDLLRQRVLYAA
jgi:transposase